MLGDEMTKNDFDAYIFCGRWTQQLVELVKANTKSPLIGWMHESAFADPMTPALDAFDAMIYVSEWQKKVTAKDAKPHWKQTVIRNAMNPAVAKSFPPGEKILPAKTRPPVLLFAGSFARGAFHIPPLLDKIRSHRSDFSVEMFCNLDPSRDAEKDSAYIGWLRSLPNISHIGMVGQGELARRMKRAAVFVAPNPWPETSCIALIEALASGMSAVTTSRAALPETASGFARQVSIDHADDPLRFDMPIDYSAFAEQILQAIDQPNEPALRKQIDYFHAHYQWAQRVQPWIDFISSLRR
jgi:glycosyltransferase involved in cell wall biosynthesis